ncbi:MAG TPA: helix-turn-helix domain-containing GNAT family N-acetyltransferase [Bryobacteraceae bacterium]|nr:helix-turn-helix domain-containing GNAT family N-acetyltransferase [Bryobacteraceae bacterium]
MPDPHVAAVRAFNRFYTRRIGALGEGHLASPFSLTEARVLYELAHRENSTAGEIARDLDLDAGYLSRILRRFEERRLLSRRRGRDDGRRSELRLTRAGRQAFLPLDRGADRQTATMLEPLSGPARARVVESMQQIERLLASAAAPPAISLRSPRPGDMGWVIHRHGVLYFEEYGWGQRFEALVAGVVAQFAASFDPARERCWIAEADGIPAGCIFCVRHSDEVAKLRLLLVEPAARGLGVGRRLVEECIAFARQCGYRTLSLWTQDILLPARHIYRTAGFRLVREERHAMFGPEMTGEYWELPLT